MAHDNGPDGCGGCLVGLLCIVAIFYLMVHC